MILYSNDGDDIVTEHKFRIINCIGVGSSSMVYTAEYINNSISHQCLLKELYPINCGLEREGFTSLVFSSDDFRKRYEAIEKKFMIGYALQVGMQKVDYNAKEQQEQLVAGMIAPAHHIYHDKNGILYTEYGINYGCTFDKDKCDDIDHLLNITGLIAMFLENLHKHGYLMLDVKESNIFITQIGETKIANLFDFGSVVKKEDLVNYDHNDPDGSLSFTSSDSTLTLPQELRSIINTLNDPDIDQRTAYDCVNDIVINNLAIDGERTDLALLSAILYHKLFNEPAPAVKTASDLIIPDCGITDPDTKSLLEKIFMNTLGRMSERYPDSDTPMADFQKDIANLRKSIAASKTAIITNEAVRQCSLNHLKKLEKKSASGGRSAELNGKFYNISTSKCIYTNCIKSLDTGIEFSSLNAVTTNSRLSLIQGDGGIGKSSLLYDYWHTNSQKENSPICLYVELLSYRTDHNDIHVTSGDIPADLLSFITNNIIKQYDPKKHSYNEFETRALANGLDMLLSERNDDAPPQYTLLIDGLNEIIDPSIRDSVLKDITAAAKRWDNTAIVVTTRPGVVYTLNTFDRYTVKGLSDSVIDQQLSCIENYSLERKTLLHRKKIWELLKMPMFLDIYLSIVANGASFNDDTMNRGKLLEQYINKVDCQTDTPLHFHNLTVKCILPFIANQMCRSHEMSISYDRFMTLVEEGVKFFIEDNAVIKNYTIFIDEDVKLLKNSYTVEQICKMAVICITATGHCILTDNSQQIVFSHQYLHDFFAARHISNLISIARNIENNGLADKLYLRNFVLEKGADYHWSNEVCTLFGEIER